MSSKGFCDIVIAFDVMIYSIYRKYVPYSLYGIGTFNLQSKWITVYLLLGKFDCGVKKYKIRALL